MGYGLRRASAAAAVFALGVLVLESSNPAAGLSRAPAGVDGDISAALRAIKADEARLRAVRLHASYKYSYTQANGKILQGGFVCNAVLEGVPVGKFRLNVLRQEFGVGNRVEVNSFYAAFNGDIFTHLLTAVNHGGRKWYPLEHGLISTRVPARAWNYFFYAGWSSTVYGFTTSIPKLPPVLPDFRRMRFSDYLRPGGGPKWSPTRVIAKWTSRAGVRLLRVRRIGQPLGQEDFYLDPSKAYAIVYYKHRDWRVVRGPNGQLRFLAGGPLVSTFRVEQFAEPAPGIFYPRKIVIKGYRKKKNGGAPVENSRDVLKISHIRVNAKARVRQRQFVVLFPRDTEVTDESTGKTVVIGGTPEQQRREIQRDLGKARAQTGR